jgi:hypothetical protein|tara:strand:+ start:2323 stop:2583 length:261 start_codon:yes stop_codon:yes gene_type:complete
MFEVYKKYFVAAHPLGLVISLIFLIRGIIEGGEEPLWLFWIAPIFIWGSIAHSLFKDSRKRFYELWIFWIIFPSIIFGGFYLYELF